MIATIKGIAAEAKVSHQAVSAVLNNKTNCRVSQETRERILKIASESGYRINFGYKLMQGKSTHTVAVLVATDVIWQEEHIKNLTLKLLLHFEKLGYATYCGYLSANPSESLDKVREMVQRGVEHIVFVRSPFGGPEIEDFLERAGVTYIQWGDYLKRYVCHANHQGLQEIYRYFISEVGENFKLVCHVSQCHSQTGQIMALAAVFPDLSWEELIRKFVFAVEDLDSKEGWLESTFKSGRNAMKNLLAQYPDIGAVAFMNDSSALGGADYIIQHGINPRPLISGVNNDITVQHYPLPISSVAFDLDTIVDKLTTYAVNHEPCKIIVPSKAIIRK